MTCCTFPRHDRQLPQTMLQRSCRSQVASSHSLEQPAARSPSHTQSRLGLGTCPSPTLGRVDLDLSPGRRVRTWSGVGLKSPTEGRDLDLSPRPTAGTGRPAGLKSPWGGVFNAQNRVKSAQICSDVLDFEGNSLGRKPLDKHFAIHSCIHSDLIWTHFRPFSTLPE